MTYMTTGADAPDRAAARARLFALQAQRGRQARAAARATNRALPDPVSVERELERVKAQALRSFRDLSDMQELGR